MNATVKWYQFVFAEDVEIHTEDDWIYGLAQQKRRKFETRFTVNDFSYCICIFVFFKSPRIYLCLFHLKLLNSFLTNSKNLEFKLERSSISRAYLDTCSFPKKCSKTKRQNMKKSFSCEIYFIHVSYLTKPKVVKAFWTHFAEFLILNDRTTLFYQILFCLFCLFVYFHKSNAKLGLNLFKKSTQLSSLIKLLT